jgi:hypothetical protein
VRIETGPALRAVITAMDLVGSVRDSLFLSAAARYR